jgi:hypothetical protein
MLPVDPEFIAIAHEMQRAPTRSTARSGGLLAPALVPLAEFRYLGYSLKYMHEYARRIGIQISYPGFCAWMKNNVGPQSGIGSKAAWIVQDAVNQGAYTSPYFQKQDEEFSRTRKNESGGEGATPLPPQPMASGPPAPDIAAAGTGTGNELASDSSDAGPSEPDPASLTALEEEEEKKRKLKVLREGLKAFDGPFKKIHEENLTR